LLALPLGWAGLALAPIAGTIVLGLGVLAGLAAIAEGGRTSAIAVFGGAGCAIVLLLAWLAHTLGNFH
jgi:hypothetical protein